MSQKEQHIFMINIKKKEKELSKPIVITFVEAVEIHL